MIRNVLLIAALLLAFGGGIWLTRSYYAAQEVKAQEQSQVLLEKIKTVCKLVTVEGYFSEVYDYKDYWGYDWSPFQKKALLRIKAKVSCGYDLGKISVESRPAEKTILLGNLPEPGILSIEHDLDYYDITEGTFNSFSPEDYNKINAKAKEYIRDQALKSDLVKSAKAQGNQLIDMIRLMVESAGWKLELKSEAPPPLLQK